MRAFRAHALFLIPPANFYRPPRPYLLAFFSTNETENVYRVTHGSLEARRFLTRLK